MTSLIFGSIVLAHQAYHTHRHEKQRVKNYRRWEGLRDEYDLQKQTQRSSQSLDLERTGSGWNTPTEDRGIFTLRDQQEANDARLSWRPQEQWHGEEAPVDQRRHSVQIQETGRGRYSGEIRPQKTGACWDEGLPAPLRVSRKSFDDGDHYSGNVTPERSGSRSARPSGEYSRPSGEYPRASGEFSRTTSTTPAYRDPSHPLSQTTTIEPITSNTPGGRMAELLEQDKHRSSSPLNPHRQQPNVYSVPLTAEQKLPEVSTAVVGDWWTRP